jgi:hypothetical protein
MRRLAERNACLELFPVTQQLCQIIFFLVLVSGGMVMLAPPAEAGQCGDALKKLEGADLSRELASENFGSVTPVCEPEEDANRAPTVSFGIDNQRGFDLNSPGKKRSQRSQLPDFNREIYYRNKLEFSLDAGWLPINIPFPLDFLLGDSYNLYPLRYTLVPVIASLRWHVDSVGGPLFLRGNWDVTFSGSATAIPKGAETHYFSYDMGIRRNFVPRNWRVAPYVDLRLGLGEIDAKGPLGVYYAQGQNYTFTCNFGAGARYNFNSRYAVSAGLNWMHISNANLSSPQYSNYGINVYGPMFGIDMRLGGPRRHPGQ